MSDDCLYRFDSGHSSDIASVIYKEFKIIRRTPKGAWIKYWNEKGEKFVNLEARKQFASETKEIARTNFLARKKRYASILSSRLRSTEAEIRIMERANVIKLKDFESIKFGYFV